MASPSLLPAVWHEIRPCAYSILLCLIAFQVIAGIVETLGKHEYSILVETKAELAPMVLLVDVPIKNSSININFNILKDRLLNYTWEGCNYIPFLIRYEHQRAFTAKGVMERNLFWVNRRRTKNMRNECRCFSDIFISCFYNSIGAGNVQSVIWNGDKADSVFHRRQARFLSCPRLHGRFGFPHGKPDLSFN